MYLSKLMLNPRHRQVQRELSHPYELHRTVMRGLPEDLPEEERVLYRLEMSSRSGEAVLLVQSHTAPDWVFLEKKRTYLLAPPLVKAFHLNVRPGQVLRFRLHANPTMKTWSKSTEKKTRVPLVREEEQLAWLHRKGQQHGFRLVAGEKGLPLVRVTKLGDRIDRIYRENTEQRLKIYVIQFDGFLQVTDPDRLLDAVRAGIGPAKSFGCGLLSLARAA